MSSHTTSQDSRSAQEARRRKRRERKERGAKSPVPEPKDVVGGAGLPLDVSVRRELEERLGHDLGRVRLHTDRDAAALTDLLGADAVAVGQDIFFREGAYRPGTADGMRLLAHELLHTVQNPDGLGALRAYRDLGAVSLPQQTVEREAETAARASAEQDAARGGGTDGAAAERVEEGRATPGWLRYATVDADRRRMEQIDPAMLLDRLTNGLLRSLRGDPQDRSKRVRIQLARFSPEMQDAVLDRLESRLLSSEFDRLVELVEETEDEGTLEPEALGTPEAVPDATELLEDEREDAETADRRQQAEDERSREGRSGEQDGGQRTGEERQDRERPDRRRGDRGSAGAARPRAGRPTGRSGGPGRQTGSTGSSGPDSDRAAASGGGASRRQPQQPRQQDGSGTGGRSEVPGVGGAPAASKEESAARNRPGAVEPLVAGQQPGRADERDTRDGKRA
ncbi:DUF4157 domain-containing protein [Streptomyces radiopugnans]|nr:DUF4157 domain-containing protein [Streptomyces radiopugnans]